MSDDTTPPGEDRRKAAMLKRGQLESEIRASDATARQKSNMLHTLSKLWQFASDVIDESRAAPAAQQAAPTGEPDLCTVGDLRPDDVAEAAEDLHGTAGGMIPAGAIIEMRSRVGGACFAALVVSREGVALRVGLAGKVRRLCSAAAQQAAPAETLTIDRLLRTACQVALLPDDAPGNEDAGLAAVQVLLTPAARVQLALDALAGIPTYSDHEVVLRMRGRDALDLLLGCGGAPEVQLRLRDWQGQEAAVAYDQVHLRRGAVHVWAQGPERPATAEEIATLTATGKAA